MPALNLLYYPDPILRKVSKKIITFDKDLRSFLNDLAETMYEFNGVGLAAPQVGVLKRVCVVDISHIGNSTQFYINPEIIWSDEPVKSEEGCLSIPNYRDSVPRYRKIKVLAQSGEGIQFTQEAEDLEAFALQHEIDHLNGVLFVDKLSMLKREMFKRWFKKHGIKND